ncbi:YHYH domain-containing protein [Metabacillus fastidiosus]|uniref:YHYH domain-containing protein n=1 Tax=Metabacillus fastidiosus TaxID=1458 RepID=UPI000824A41D|nr:YHYH domain-containing protein [Metabacillus fastidiosus]MED4461813.1 YHYH domain-containing protein [Metabacillus fastidiosus]
MKNLAIIILILLTLGISDSVYAHPGRTDGNGGHTCRTNCAKWGYSTGEYHTHNGGSSSSSGGDSSSSSSSSVVESSGPSPEEIAAQEQTQGEKEGYQTGYTDGYADAVKNDVGSGTDAYVEGYETGYLKGYDEGMKKLEAEKISANKQGYDLGKNQDNIEIPDTVAKHEPLKVSFEDGFNKAVTEREESEKEKFNILGYNDGIKDVNNELKNTKEIYITAYQEGYEKAQEELKQQYYDKGYEAAFTTLKYKKPALKNEKFIDWYKEGFTANDEVKEIQDTAFNLGKNGEDYIVPEQYTKSEVIFKHYYEIGAQENQKENAQAAGGLGIVVLGWLARRFYVAKKTIS